MTFKEMQDMIAMMVEATWEDRGATRFRPTLVKRMVNNAHQYVATNLAWNRSTETISMVDGTREYSVGATERQWLAVVYVDDSAGLNLLLEHVNLTKFLQIDQTEETESRPEVFCRHGNQIMLWPTPDDSNDTLKVYYVSDVADLSADGDEPTYPAHLHQTVVDLAFAAAHDMMGEVETASALKLQAKAEIALQRHLPAMARGGGRMQNRSSI